MSTLLFGGLQKKRDVYEIFVAGHNFCGRMRQRNSVGVWRNFRWRVVRPLCRTRQRNLFPKSGVEKPLTYPVNDFVFGVFGKVEKGENAHMVFFRDVTILLGNNSVTGNEILYDMTFFHTSTKDYVDVTCQQKLQKPVNFVDSQELLQPCQKFRRQVLKNAGFWW